jgi:hypothetical protein
MISKTRLNLRIPSQLPRNFDYYVDKSKSKKKVEFKNSIKSVDIYGGSQARLSNVQVMA